MTDAETINKYVNVSRSNDTRLIYPENYTAELELVKNKLKQKYANEIVTTTKENYKIKLTAMKQAQTKADTIANNVIKMSNTALKKAVASQTKKR